MSEPCSDDSLRRNEPLGATAPTATRVLLVSATKASWGSEGAKMPQFSPFQAWAKALDQRRGGNTTVRLFAGAEGEARIYPEGIRVKADFPALPKALDAALELGKAEAPHTFVVCTHGKYDACCARYGQGVFQKLKADAQFEVLESSHLGGHRFAATGIDLKPHRPMRMYGRIRESEVETLLAHLNAGTVWIERYRGQLGLKPAWQLAEIEALKRGAIEPEMHQQGGVITASWNGGEVRITTQRQGFEGLKACDQKDVWERVLVDTVSG